VNVAGDAGRVPQAERGRNVAAGVAGTDRRRIAALRRSDLRALPDRDADRGSRSGWCFRGPAIACAM
jgi:hypothetical protein